MIPFFSSYLRRGNERSIKAKKNIFFLALIKIVSITISLLLVSVTINYIDTSRYGIWLTVSSIVIWVGIFDIGLSNGMRNKFAVAVANKEYEKAKIFVSTTYTTLFIIFSCLSICFLLLNNYINWCAILKIPSIYDEEVRLLITIVFIYFCIQFILKTVNSILTASQQPARAAFIDMLGQFFALLSILILTKTTQPSLVYLGLGLTIPPLVVLLIANLYVFNGAYKKFRPSIKHFRTKYLKDIFGLSFKFFIIQIAALIQYQTANIIIARNFSLESVTDYNLTYKYFNVLFIGFMMLLTPFWSAATDAYTKKDFPWINNAIKRYNQFFLLFIGAGIIMLTCTSFIYDLWIGKDIVSIPFSLSLWAFLYTITTMYGAIYVNLLNGISAVKIQFILSIFTPILFLLLCWLFIAVFNWGVYSIFVASIISNCNGIIFAPIQYHKIFIKKKGGIWKA